MSDLSFEETEALTSELARRSDAVIVIRHRELNDHQKESGFQVTMSVDDEHGVANYALAYRMLEQAGDMIEKKEESE